MKNLNKFLALITVMTLMACGNGRNATSTNTTDNRTVSTTDRNSDTDAKMDRMDNTSKTDRMYDENDYGYTDYDRTRMNNLYTHFNWNDDQIERYERASRQNMDTWMRTNPNSTLSAQQRMTLEDQSMKGFLDANQYTSYQQWVRDNPYKY